MNLARKSSVIPDSFEEFLEQTESEDSESLISKLSKASEILNSDSFPNNTSTKDQINYLKVSKINDNDTDDDDDDDYSEANTTEVDKIRFFKDLNSLKTTSNIIDESDDEDLSFDENAFTVQILSDKGVIKDERITTGHHHQLHSPNTNSIYKQPSIDVFSSLSADSFVVEKEIKTSSSFDNNKPFYNQHNEVTPTTTTKISLENKSNAIQDNYSLSFESNDDEDDDTNLSSVQKNNQIQTKTNIISKDEISNASETNTSLQKAKKEFENDNVNLAFTAAENFQSTSSTTTTNEVSSNPEDPEVSLSLIDLKSNIDLQSHVELANLSLDFTNTKEDLFSLNNSELTTQSSEIMADEKSNSKEVAVKSMLVVQKKESMAPVESMAAPVGAVLTATTTTNTKPPLLEKTQLSFNDFLKLQAAKNDTLPPTPTTTSTALRGGQNNKNSNSIANNSQTKSPTKKISNSKIPKRSSFSSSPERPTTTTTNKTTNSNNNTPTRQKPIIVINKKPTATEPKPTFPPPQPTTPLKDQQQINHHIDEENIMLLDLKKDLADRQVEIDELKLSLFKATQELLGAREEIVLIERMEEERKAGMGRGEFLRTIDWVDGEGVDLGRVRKDVEEQEVLIRGFQMENEKLTLKIKSLQKETKEKDKLNFLKFEQNHRDLTSLKSQLASKDAIDFKITSKLESLTEELSQQGQKFLTKEEDLNATIRKLKGSLDEAKKALFDQKKAMGDEIEKVKDSYQGYVDEIETRAGESGVGRGKKDLKVVGEDSGSLRIQLTKLDMEKRKLEKEFIQKLELKNEQYELLKTNTAKTIQDLQSKITILTTTTQSDNRLTTLETKLKKLDPNIIQDQKSQISTLETQLNKANKNINNLTTSKTHLELEISKFKSDNRISNSKLESELYLYKEKNASFESLQGRLKILEKEITGRDTEILILEKNLESSEASRAGAEKVAGLLRTGQEDAIIYYEDLLVKIRLKNQNSIMILEKELEVVQDRLKVSEQVSREATNELEELKERFDNMLANKENSAIFDKNEQKRIKELIDANARLTEQVVSQRKSMSPHMIRFQDLMSKIEGLEGLQRQREIEIEHRLGMMEANSKQDVENVKRNCARLIEKKNMEVIRFRKEVDELLAMINDLRK